MRRLQLLTISLLLVSLTSCNRYFYQIYDVKSDENMTTKKENVVFENSDFKISYNFWQDGGSAGFVAYNKTNSDLVIDKSRSFFIMNGYANDYFRNRVYKETNSASYSSSTSAASFSSALNVALGGASSASSYSGNSMTSVERQEVVIPPHTRKHIDAYAINQDLLQLCDQEKFPSRSEIKSNTYSKSNSPIVFSNRISYREMGSQQTQKFKNEFFVGKITNYPKNEIVEKRDEMECGEKVGMSKIEINTKASPDRFYIYYQ